MLSSHPKPTLTEEVMESVLEAIASALTLYFLTHIFSYATRASLPPEDMPLGITELPTSLVREVPYIDTCALLERQNLILLATVLEEYLSAVTKAKADDSSNVHKLTQWNFSIVESIAGGNPALHSVGPESGPTEWRAQTPDLP